MWLRKDVNWMFRRIARVPLASTVGALVVLGFCAGPLHADLGGPTADSWSALFRNASCALAIAATAGSGGVAIAAVVVMCVRILFIDV
jgi:hypothetical protein